MYFRIKELAFKEPFPSDNEDLYPGDYLIDFAKNIYVFILWNPVDQGLSLEGTPDDPRFAYVKRK